MSVPRLVTSAFVIVTMLAALATLAACGGTEPTPAAQPAATPVVVEREVVKEVPVEKPVLVEKEVVRTITVEKPVLVVATPTPTKADYPRTVTDAFGNTTTIRKADSVVAVVPSVSDAIFGLGQGHRVVGRTKRADWPPGVIETIPNVGDYSGLNAEGILSLGADLIIVPDWASGFEKNQGVFEQLRGAGADFLVIPERQMAEQDGRYTMRVLEEFVRLVADALAVPEKGEELVAKMRAEAEAARKLAEASEKKVRVLSMLPYSPGSTRVTGAMKPEDLVIQLAGGINAGLETGVVGEKEVVPEALVNVAPEVIVVPDTVWSRYDDPVKVMLEIPGVAETPAGKARRFAIWPSIPTHRASWRLPQAARELAEQLYGGDR